MTNSPIEWQPRPVDIKSGWKNNAKILAEIVDYVNGEKYVEYEDVLMEQLDEVLEYLKSKYKITKK